ncbi:DUF6544 family protein [Daejeonella oryzae]|uniref:DUF6544 family protein n=1 Tax=Daejeonella oryzae TaxID=1122943 RepID=UPI0003F779AE|nr:DUF6544 family protein [Daejeonella oryzae]
MILKYIFAFILFIHGLLHFTGFAKAFNFTSFGQFTIEVSKSAALAWLLTAGLFIASALMYFFKKDRWSLVAIIAVLFSQILIITVWKDARWWTLTNCIVSLIAVPDFGNFRFNRMVNSEISSLLSGHWENKTVITNEMLENLPAIVRQWLVNSGVVGKEKIQFVRLRQKGEMRTKPNGKWMKFRATEYFTVNEPQFVWKTRLKMGPFLSLTGRDKFMSNIADMQIKLLSVINLVHAKDNTKLNSASMIRYLAEIVWFPSAALNHYIKWESIDATSAKATLSYNGTSVSGIFRFNEKANFLSFEADRYMNNGSEASIEKWCVEVTGYKYFQGIRIPYKNEVTWKLKSGDFNWANIELTDLKYNLPV